MAGKMTDEPDVVDNIRTALHKRPDLVAVYLFGSTARDQAHALSDVDVAALFVDELSAADLFARTLEIGAILEDALRRPVDVIALNRAPPALCFQVLKHGRLLLEQDRTRRCLFVMHALGRYYDAKPYLDYHNARLLSRVRKEGLGRGYYGHRDALAQARQLSAYLAADASSAPG
ncbi:MAG: nucleotidyltransferase domain-containing protein [Anaerolineae bacterium]|nr:MAG: nucleotidyltransferase domain-containing protein [Anaerolineae bacterium]